jgi:hypothetical protein
MDPRVKTPAADLKLQFDLSKSLYDGINRAYDALSRMRQARGAGEATAEERALARLHQQMLSMLDLVQEADVKPTSQAIAAVQTLTASLAEALK